MALIVEDGSGLEAAESYVSVAECSAYFSGRGNEAWSDADGKEPALRKASQYIDAVYRFKGDRYSRTQGLSWPRANVVFDGYDLPVTEIPKALKDACCELALRATSEDLIADVSAQYAEEVRVGPITKKLSGPANGGQKRFALVDSLLADLIVSGSGGSAVRLVRA